MVGIVEPGDEEFKIVYLNGFPPHTETVWLKRLPPTPHFLLLKHRSLLLVCEFTVARSLHILPFPFLASF
jgi:hypothetical protein